MYNGGLQAESKAGPYLKFVRRGVFLVVFGRGRRGQGQQFPPFGSGGSPNCNSKRGREAANSISRSGKKTKESKVQ